MKTIDIQNSTTAALLAFYNEHTEKKVARFADRKTAERRVQALIDSMPKEEVKGAKTHAKLVAATAFNACPSCGATVDQTGGRVNGKGEVVKEHLRTCHVCGTEYDGTTGRVLRKVGQTLSKSIKESWARPEIAAKRAERNHVLANGTEYNSVNAAFVALGLPVQKVIKFRMQLKAAGTLNFGEIKFEVVR